MSPGFRVCHSLEEAPDFGPCALTIGTFDGVHAGHRHIFERVVEVGRASGWKPSVVTFTPHPATIVARERAPKLLSRADQRAEWMRQCGIEQVLVLPFDAGLAAFSPDEFARLILAGRLGARAVFVGDNFRFGYQQAGDARLLAELGLAHGFTTEIVSAIQYRRRHVSSTTIRNLISSGNVALAARMLGRPHFLDGRLVAGRGIGSKQTVPTLNLATDSEVIPATGVYITRTRDLDSARRWNSITNIGYRPTFGQSSELSVETFLLDPFEGEKPMRMRLEFLRRVREERKFDSPEVLRAQILRDVARAQAYLRRIRAYCPALAPYG